MAEARTIGSLPVANVQALAETCNRFSDKIPERYIRTEAISEDVIIGFDSTSAIPIIDLNKLLARQSSEEECAREAGVCLSKLGLFSDKRCAGPAGQEGWKWFTVDASDSAFIVNVGDTLEIPSNGKFRSAEHRAVIHPNKGRISVVMFQYPCQDLMVRPLPEFVKDDKVRYSSTSYQDYLMQVFKEKLDGKKHLERLKLVAIYHWPLLCCPTDDIPCYIYR